MYKCFVKGCDKDSIVCYGNGGMGEPARCVCIEHVKEDIPFLYKRLQILQNINSKLMLNNVFWNDTSIEPPLNRPLWIGRWWSDSVLGMKKEDGWYYLDGDKIDNSSHKVLCWAEISYPQLPDWFEKVKWDVKND